MGRWTVPAGEVDLDEGVLHTPVGPVPLTERECDLLRYLRAQDGRTVSREELLERVWGYAPGARSRAVDTAVQRLREKLETNPALPRVLHTVRGEGYRLGDADPIEPSRAPAATAFPRLDRLIGRGAELRQATALLHAGHRLVALTGPPGVGKTWLARRVGTTIAELGQRSVWFADLTDVSTPEALRDTVAHALDLPRPLAGADAVRDALAALGPSVGVLDDAQALDDAAAALVGEWVRQVPSLAVLLTSHRPLALEGERRIAVEPLDDAAAVELLRDRLVALAVEPPHSDVLREMCRRLDGLPLAIELAAPLLEVMAPEAWLAGPIGWAPPRPDAPPRHRSLDAAVGAATAALPDDARGLLLGLSVFAGPFDPEAATVVGQGEVLPALALLRRRSLLRRSADDRLALYGAVRDWARARLEPPRRARLAEAHAQWVLASAPPLAELVHATVDGPHALRDQLSAALLTRLRSSGPIELATPVLERALAGLDLVRVRSGVLCALSEALRLVGRVVEAEARAVEAEALADGDPVLVARSLVVRSKVQGDMSFVRDAVDLAREAVALAREVGDPEVEHAALSALAAALDLAHDREGTTASAEMGRIGLALGRSLEAAQAWMEAGNTHSYDGRYDQALASYDQALALARDTHPRLAGVVQANRGYLLVRRGDLDAAREAFGAAETLLRAVADPRMLASVEVRRALLDVAMGDRTRALRRLRRVRRTEGIRAQDDARAAIYLAVLTGDVGEMLPPEGSGPLRAAAVALLAGEAIPPGTPPSEADTLTLLAQCGRRPPR